MRLEARDRGVSIPPTRGAVAELNEATNGIRAHDAEHVPVLVSTMRSSMFAAVDDHSRSPGLNRLWAARARSLRVLAA
jgi:hypothetical protein